MFSVLRRTNNRRTGHLLSTRYLAWVKKQSAESFETNLWQLPRRNRKRHYWKMGKSWKSDDWFESAQGMAYQKLGNQNRWIISQRMAWFFERKRVHQRIRKYVQTASEFWYVTQNIYILINMWFDSTHKMWFRFILWQNLQSQYCQGVHQDDKRQEKKEHVKWSIQDLCTTYFQKDCQKGNLHAIRCKFLYCRCHLRKQEKNRQNSWCYIQSHWKRRNKSTVR